MLRIIDRYILREVIPPFLLALLVFTFLLMIPPIMEVAEDLIAKGVDADTIVRIMVTLVPQGLGITIPISLLLGILMGLGRLSTDRETVAIQACGVSVFRMLYPLVLLGVATSLATCYILVVALPDANQAFREITFRTVAGRAEGEVKPRVFYDDFPNVMLYTREVSGEGWADVFVADMRKSIQPDVYVAQQGQIVLDPEQRSVDIVLRGGTGHQVSADDPTTYEVHHFDEIVIQLDPESVFPRSGPQRGIRELSITQLQAEADRMSDLGVSPHRPIMEIHRKFSIPVACLVFALIGLGLGVTSRKDGKLASFALGIGVIFTYYVFMYGAESMAKGALVSPHLAMWLPNIVLGMFGLALVIWRSSSVERWLALPFLAFLSRRRHDPPSDTSGAVASLEAASHGTRLATGVRLPQARVLGLNILDRYVTRVYLGIVVLSFVALLGIFYISTFIDLSDKLFKGQTTGMMLLQYFFFATPQFTYYVLPIAALVATLVTVGLLTKTSELTVMKACGISLYRAVMPIFLFSLIWSGLLFGLSESVLAAANRRAAALNHEIRIGVPPVDVLNRKWIVGENGSIYHYLSMDPDVDEIDGLSVYEFTAEPWTLSRRTFANQAAYRNGWEGHDVWVRDFTHREGEAIPLETAAMRPLAFLEPPDYFETERPDAELMSFGELDTYIEELRSSGFDVVQLVVALHRKVSFPFVTLILTLIAVPFALTIGPRGALYGVGVGISLACAYWVIISIFGAIGSAGMLAPMLAAWAPNLLFGASATYLLLTVRT